MLTIAHRGASGHAPEHTLAAYDLAIEMGADCIEQDLQMTRDGVLVVLHDDTLDRTARGPACRGLVRERTFADVRRCDIGSWYNERHPEQARAEYAGQRVPSLEELFQRYGQRVRYYIELKDPDASPDMVPALYALLERYELLRAAAERRQVFVQSFSRASLRALRAIDHALPLIQLTRRRRTSAWISARLDDIATCATGIGPEFRSVDAELVTAAHDRGLLVHTYTVNDEHDMRRLRDLGVDGIFTDYPDRALALAASP